MTALRRKVLPPNCRTCGGTAHKSTIDYPGQHDFVVVASDGVTFNLSRTMLAATSDFFADMFTVGEASSWTQSSSERTVNALENHVVLDSLFAISYSHPKRPEPNIETFAQIAELIRVAEKYSMRHALHYLSFQLTLPRIQGTTVVQPFTVTHPLATLSLSSTQGFNLPARLALKEVVNSAKSVWDTTFGDATLDGFMLDFRTLKKIHRMRHSRKGAYKGFIENLQPVPNNSNQRFQTYYSGGGFGGPPLSPQPSECVTCIQNWKTDLLKKFEETPNSAAFSAAFYKGWTCGKCGQLLVSHNRQKFEAFIALRTAEDCALPELH